MLYITRGGHESISLQILQRISIFKEAQGCFCWVNEFKVLSDLNSFFKPKWRLENFRRHYHQAPCYFTRKFSISPGTNPRFLKVLDDFFFSSIILLHRNTRLTWRSLQGLSYHIGKRWPSLKTLKLDLSGYFLKILLWENDSIGRGILCALISNTWAFIW